MSAYRRDASGFTLIEVLVALAIVVVGLAALATTANQSARTTTYLRDKTMAQWIALNRITEIRIGGTVPADDVSEGELEFGGREWRWELERIQTPVEGIFRLESRAALADAKEGNWLGQATGFMGTAIAPASPTAIPDWTGITTQGPGTPGGPRQPGEEPSPTPPPGGQPQQ